MNDFASRLLAWYRDSGRHDLPWQSPRDAYRIWISEIMLQQTQVQTVIPYFEQFMLRFPDVQTLAAAPLDAVLHHWSGLGYYARARNLHLAAQRICELHGGRFPEVIEAATALPGVGRSTASAILSLAYDQRHAILDGNVKRVLARHEAIGGWPGATAVANALWAVAERYTPAADTAAYTQAIMDLGATLCTRTQPDCERCPVRRDCRALAAGTVADYPGKKPRKAKPLRATTMLIARMDERIFLERRPAAGIWGGLWGLPEVGEDEIHDWCRERLEARVIGVERWQLMRHSFTHFDLDIRPIVVRVEAPLGKVADGADTTWYRLDGAPPGGIAAPVSKLMQQLGEKRNVSQD